MAFISGITPQRAWQLGFDWCEIRMSPWAVYWSDSSPLTEQYYRFQFPTIPAEYFPPLTGIAIAPSSTISKAIVWYNNGTTTPADKINPIDLIVGGPRRDVRTDYTGNSQFIITTKRPWLAPVNTSNGELYFGSETAGPNTPQLKRIVVAAHPDSWAYDRYTQNGAGSSSNFGWHLNTGLQDPIFISPELHLIAYFRKQPIVPIIREPFYHIGNMGLGSSTERLARVFPIEGRNKFRLMLAPTLKNNEGRIVQSSNFVVRITGVKQGLGAYYDTDHVPDEWAATIFSGEDQINQATNFSATHRGTWQQVTITGDLNNYQYLLVYLTDTLEGWYSLDYNFSAEDE